MLCDWIKVLLKFFFLFFVESICNKLYLNKIFRFFENVIKIMIKIIFMIDFVMFVFLKESWDKNFIFKVDDKINYSLVFNLNFFLYRDIFWGNMFF